MAVKREGGLLLKLSSTEKKGLFERRGLKDVVIIVFLPLRCKKKCINPALIASER